MHTQGLQFNIINNSTPSSRIFLMSLTVSFFFLCVNTVTASKFSTTSLIHEMTPAVYPPQFCVISVNVIMVKKQIMS